MKAGAFVHRKLVENGSPPQTEEKVATEVRCRPQNTTGTPAKWSDLMNGMGANQSPACSHITASKEESNDKQPGIRRRREGGARTVAGPPASMHCKHASMQRSTHRE